MLQTRYITVNDFNNYFPEINLREELGTEENAVAFIVRLENRMETFINANFNRCIEKEYPVFTEYQKKHYKQALLEQAIYIYKNSDISVDSGYDMDKGEVVSRDKIVQSSIAPNAKQELLLCGLWNRNIRSNRSLGSLGFWWLR